MLSTDDVRGTTSQDTPPQGEAICPARYAFLQRPLSLPPAQAAKSHKWQRVTIAKVTSFFGALPRVVKFGSAEE